MRLSTLIKQFEFDYLQRYGQTCLPSHRTALSRLRDCRSEFSPRMKLECSDCEQSAYLPHSCGHRHCPHCQHHASQAWIDQQLKRRVKGNYVMITFTVPAQFRALFYTHQRDLYTLLFATVWETLQRFSQNDKQLQGTPGAIAVLHTHSRKLDYHPHLHVVMPMAAINKKQRLWRVKRGNYLFDHNALATVFRAKLLKGIKRHSLPLPTSYPKKWVVDCKAVGEGNKAIIYLGRYLYRGVIREKDIIKVENGTVTFRYKDSQTKQIEIRSVDGAKFLWLILQHVLPKGFRRSRNYGFLHPNSKLLNSIQLVTQIYIHTLKPTPRAEIRCTCCGGRMEIVETRIKNHLLIWRKVPDIKLQEATV
ncbi:Transposase [hydrothermal vent metagenome]|uniref:Transposase n=1 Tax=hydrothermal vent metagenome TaxID=652676 RepID=A0A3B0ZFG6_9ZZZZ